MVVFKDKKVLIAYAYGTRNAGDFALNLGSINLLSELFEKNNMSFVSRFGEKSPDFKKTKDLLAKYEPKVNIYPCFFDVDKYRQGKFERFGKIFSASSKYVYYNFLPFTNCRYIKSPGIKAICNSDMVLCNTGNLFYWNQYRHDLAYLFGVLFPFAFSKKIKKPYGFLPQSIGEIQGLGRIILEDIFKESKFITFREDISEKIFEKIFHLKHPTFIDTAFFIEKYNDVAAKKILSDINIGKKNYLAVTIRTGKLGDVGDFNPIKLKKIFLQLRKIIEQLLKNFEYDILLICQTKIDFESTKKIYDHFKKTNRLHMIEEYDPVILRSIYKQSVTLVAMRLHSAIFALSTGTPVIGIYDEQWGPKMPGTLLHFNMSNKVFELSSIDLSKLIEEVRGGIERKEEIRKFVLGDIQLNKNELVDFLKKNMI
jgi:polysaccharide pyruvyl transferase WcaK-like protein